MKKALKTSKNNIEANDEKCHKISHLMLEQGEHGQEISELIDALRKIGYFESFRVTDNGQLSSDKCAKTPERKLKRRRKAAYRRIKKYYKSVKQYKKERLRRKLCWLLSGKYKGSEIAEMLGISRRTVIRDMNKIKPYYFRLSRSYFSKLEQERIKEFNLKLVGKTEHQKLIMLTDALLEERKRLRGREYNRRVIKYVIDLDYIKYDGFPRITQWPRHAKNLTMPYYIQFLCIKNGETHEMYPRLVVQTMKSGGWW